MEGPTSFPLIHNEETSEFRDLTVEDLFALVSEFIQRDTTVYRSVQILQRLHLWVDNTVHLDVFMVQYAPQFLQIVASTSYVLHLFFNLNLCF